MRAAIIAAVLQIALTAGAWACDGQAGKVIFEDDFSDDSGGWNLSPPHAVVDSKALQLELNNGTSSQAALNYTFNAKDADYCMDFKIPDQLAPDNGFGVSLLFWASDYSNFFSLFLYSNGNVALYKRADGHWQASPIYLGTKMPQYKPGGNVTNTLRVVAKDNKLTLFLNGTKVKVIRAQMPDAANLFGVFGQLDKDAGAKVPPIQITHFKVTAGE